MPDTPTSVSENAPVRFDVLGPLRVSDGDRVIDIPRQKERAVLAALLVEANSVVPMDRLVNQLWGDEPPPRAIGTLHAYISNLRRLLEPGRTPRAPATILVSRGSGYCVVAGADDLDAARFEQLVRSAADAARRGDDADALAAYDAALALWRGPAYADFAYDDFVAPAIRRLDELRLAAIEGRMEALLACGRHEEVVAENESLLLAEPLRERLWGQLVVALYRSGRQAEALTACRRARATLDELGLEPGAALRRLEHAVLTQAEELDLATPDGAQPPLLPASSRPTAAGAADDATVLTGRRDELAAVDDAVADASDGVGTVLLFSGDGGIGKTTVALEALRRVSARGATTAVGRCPESQTAPALWPWSQVLRQVREGPLAGALTQLLDAVHVGASAQQSRVMAAVIAALRAEGEHGPVVIVLDDVQWADELSHRLLQLIVTDLANLPVVVLLTMRTPAPASPVLEETLAALRGSPRARQLPLRGLDIDATRTLFARVAGASPADDVLAAVQQRTDGNPFFIVELARLLVAERRVHDVALVAAAVPSTVRDVVRRRLARLPEHANALLAVAAVVGPDIDVRVVEHVARIDEDTVLDLFELATVAGVLAERPDRAGIYRFAHDIVREAILEGLPGRRRARLHERALDAVVALFGDNSATAHELARHAVAATAATGAAPAVRRLLASARVAIGDSALDHAERQTRLAAQLLDEVAYGADRDALEAQVHSRLAQIVFHTRADLAEAEQRQRHALRLCDPDDAELRGHVLMGIGCYGPLVGDFAAGVSAGDELVRLGQEGHPNLLAAGHYLRSMCAWQGDLETALREAELAVAVGAGSSGWTEVPEPILHAHLALVRALDNDPAWRESAARAVDTAVRSREDWSLSWSGAFAAVAALAAGDRDACREFVDAVEHAGAALAYTAPVLRAAAAWCGSGDAATVAGAAEELQQMHDQMFRAPVITMLADVLADAGDVTAAAAARDRAARAAAETGAGGWTAVLARVAIA